MKSRNSTDFCGNFYGRHFSTKNPFELHAIAMKLKCMKIRTFQKLSLKPDSYYNARNLCLKSPSKSFTTVKS